VLNLTRALSQAFRSPTVPSSLADVQASAGTHRPRVAPLESTEWESVYMKGDSMTVTQSEKGTMSRRAAPLLCWGLAILMALSAFSGTVNDIRRDIRQMTTSEDRSPIDTGRLGTGLEVMSAVASVFAARSFENGRKKYTSPANTASHFVFAPVNLSPMQDLKKPNNLGSLVAHFNTKKEELQHLLTSSMSPCLSTQVSISGFRFEADGERIGLAFEVTPTINATYSTEESILRRLLLEAAVDFVTHKCAHVQDQLMQDSSLTVTQASERAVSDEIAGVRSAAHKLV
jgi:hypothetical protein